MRQTWSCNLIFLLVWIPYLNRKETRNASQDRILMDQTLVT